MLVPVVASAKVAPQSDVNPAATFEGNQLPDPTAIPGKEYSNDLDEDAAGNLDPGQIVHWDGLGNVWDSFDYSSGSGGIGQGPSVPSDDIPFNEDDQVDALANIRDKHFKDVINDRVPLLASFAGVADIHTSRSSAFNGLASKWADSVNNINAAGVVDDLDGLEVWGPDVEDDADMYSRFGDMDTDLGDNRVSVFRYDPDAHTSVAYLLAQTLMDVVIFQDGTLAKEHAEWDPLAFDLDAMMIWDVNDDFVFGEGDGQHGDDMILFSVRPMTTVFDGGEIFLLQHGTGIATFLNQGGLVWDTANDVAGHFNVASEDINALEALPEPATFTLLGIGGLVALLRVRRKR